MVDKLKIEIDSKEASRRLKAIKAEIIALSNQRIKIRTDKTIQKQLVQQHKQRMKSLQAAFGESIPKKTQAMYARMFDEIDRREKRLTQQSLNRTKKINSLMRNQFGTRIGGENLISKMRIKNQKTIDRTRVATDATMFDRLKTGFTKIFKLRKKQEKAIQKNIGASQKVDKRHFSQMNSDDWGQYQIDQLNKRQASHRRPSTQSGKNGRILQMPQNPLLGRMAQFGMMASGMAATMFLMQMISAQITALMTVMTEWEDSLLNIIDSTSLVSDDMKDLSYVVRDYSRKLGIAGTAAAEATGAAMQYGIDPTSQNVQQLYGLQFSENVKDFKEAAVIMNMAGTEFGDKAATQYIKRWDMYSGKNESSGTFGYEWDKLKGSGKDVLMSIWDDDYGKKMTDAMREISDWVIGNREMIGSAFDKFVAGLSAAWKMLKIITPAATIFLSLFVAKSGLQMFIWLLKSMSGLLGPLTKQTMLVSDGFATVSKGMTGAAKAGTALRGILIGITPAAIAMIAAFAAWEVGKYVWGIYQFNKALKETETIQKRLGSMSEKEKSSEKYNYESQIESAQKSIREYRTHIKRAGPGVMADEYKALVLTKLKAIEQLEAGINKIDTESAKELSIAMEKLFGKGIDSTISTGDTIAGLEKINKELGYMPILLSQIKIALRQSESKKGTAAMGLGPRVLIDQKAKFNDLLKVSAEFKQEYDLQMSTTSLSMGGMNAPEKIAFQFEAIKKMMDKEKKELIDSPYENMFEGFSNRTEIDELTAGLKALDKVFEELGFDSVTIKTIAYNTETKKLSDTIRQLDMSSYAKEIDNINQKIKEGRLTEDQGGVLKFQKQIQLEHKLLQDFEKLQGKRPLDEQKRQDIASTLLSKEQKQTLNDILIIQGKIGSAERALARERAKNLTYISKTETAKDTEIKNLKAQLSFVLGNLSKKELKYIEDRNNALKIYADRLSVISRELEAGKQQSTIQGYISETEMLKTIENRRIKMAEAIDNDGTARDAWHKKHIKNKLSEIITIEEQIKAMKSLISVTDRHAQAASRRITEQEKIKKFELIDTKYSKTNEPAMGKTDRTRAIYLEKETIDQNYFKDDVTAWNEYYNIKNTMTDDHYQYQKNAIDLAYIKNKGKMSTQNAEALKIEAEYQLALKNMRKESFGTDLGLGASEALRTIGNDYKTLGQIMEKSLVGAFNGISGAMTQWIMGTKSAKDAFKDMAYAIVEDLTSMIVKQALYNSLLGASYAAGGAMGGLFGMIGGMFAKGGVATGIGAYSNQIVAKPTFVPGGSGVTAYASGGTLFGEAGPEAIMPLSRMSSGNLGVEVGGSSTPNVQINVINNGKDVEATQDQGPKWDGEKWVIGIVLNSMITNKGGFKNNMKGLMSS